MKYKGVLNSDNKGACFNVEMKDGTFKTLIVHYSEFLQEWCLIEEKSSSNDFYVINEEDIKSMKSFNLEFLSEQTLVTDQLDYSSDEDGNISIHQENMFITLTPKQVLDLKELLCVHLDTLKFSWSKK